MTNNITIKSGIDVKDKKFKIYYNLLKNDGIKSFYLDLALKSNSPVLSDPIIFEEKEYHDYTVDDIAFILDENEIIGHMVYKMSKTRPAISLSMGSKNHLDMERVRQVSGQICFNKLEYFCKYNIPINNLIVEYLSNRIHGNLEYKGIVSIERKIHIKK